MIFYAVAVPNSPQGFRLPMEVLTAAEVKEWCGRVGLILDEDELLAYPSAEKRELFIRAPAEFRKILVLAHGLTTFRSQAHFSGGMLWLRRWDLHPMSSVGWRMLEGNRRGSGDLRSLDSAPAQYFREDELLDLQAHLVQVIGFGWVAEYVPAVGGFVLRFKDNGRIRVIANTEADLAELRKHLEDWSPTDKDPMVEELRRREAERQ
jgi:hypothetical protein